MEKIRCYFESLTSMSENDWEVFSSKLIKRSFKKNEILLIRDHTEKYLSFIEKGVIRFWSEEKDTTFAFAFENSFVSAYDSFITQTPSNYNVESLANTLLWSIHYKDLQEIYKNTLIGNYIGRLAAEDLFVKKSKRELSLLCDTAEQRYLNLLKDNPSLFQHIPLKYLASYIGITPQALSRIRKRIL